MTHQEATQTIPKEIFASFITPAPDPAPPKPQPAIPKTVAVVKKVIAPPRRPTPVVDNTPSETAISAPTPAPQPPQPEQPAAAPAASPPVAAPPQPRTISGVEYIQAPDVKYPTIAKRMGEEGKSVIRVLINEKGRAEQVEVQKSSGSSRLDDAAKQAVMRALFKPYMEDGKAMPVFAIVPINFQLSS